MNKSLILVAITALIVNTSQANAGDAAAGKAKSTTCAACHGANGTQSSRIARDGRPLTIIDD